MQKRIAALIGVIVFLAALFFISYKMTVKIKNDKTSEESSRTEADVVENTAGDDGENSATEADATEAVSSGSAQTDTPEASTEEFIPADDGVLPEPTVINMPTDESWSSVLLNKFYKMNDTYEPLVEIVIEESGIYLDRRVAEKFREMYSAAMADNVTLTPAAGYVSPERQERKFEKQVELYVAGGMSEDEAKAKAAFTVLPAGCSESNYGLAVDIGWFADDFAQSPAYAWLKSHAAEYGFVERYTAEKTAYTHFNAQPWHWRYVGVDAAKYMNEQDICLEQYVGKVN